jgi:hypothetical protein
MREGERPPGLENVTNLGELPERVQVVVAPLPD